MRLLEFVGETEMEDLEVVGILGPENFESKKESCEAEFVKELDFKRRPLDFIEKGEKWDVWRGTQAGFESLDLMK